MNSSIWNPRRKAIVVGLVLNKDEQSLIDAACALARKLGSPLELVHATQPIFNYMGAGDVVVNPYFGYDRVISDIEEDEARKSLAKIKNSLPEDIAVNVHVMRDYSSEALSTIASEVHAGMILCAVKKDDKGNLFGGMSTAFSLASHSDIPVMIVPQGSKIDFNKRPRMLVADNLELEGRRALEAAIQLAADLDSTEISHIHVHQLGQSEVKAMVEKVREAMNLGKIPTNPDFSTETYIDQMKQKIAEDLNYRFHNSQGAALLKSQYHTHVAFGNPAEELQKAAHQYQAQMIVFGRHHLFHKRGFTLGKIPYDAMINEGLATLIVPDLDPAQLSAPKKA